MSSDDRSSIFQRLKQATSVLHHQVEARLGIFNCSFDLAAYLDVLRRFYGYWAPTELLLSEVAELRDSTLDFPSRCKTRLLEADLRYLGADLASIERCRRLPDVTTLAKSYGCLYVLEGSTLGSQLIAPHLRARFQLDQGCGASFFNAYGHDTGRKWAKFRSSLLMHIDLGSEAELIKSAQETFRTLDNWLSRSNPPTRGALIQREASDN